MMMVWSSYWRVRMRLKLVRMTATMAIMIFSAIILSLQFKKIHINDDSWMTHVIRAWRSGKTNISRWSWLPVPCSHKEICFSPATSRKPNPVRFPTFIPNRFGTQLPTWADESVKLRRGQKKTPQSFSEYISTKIKPRSNAGDKLFLWALSWQVSPLLARPANQVASLPVPLSWSWSRRSLNSPLPTCCSHDTLILARRPIPTSTTPSPSSTKATSGYTIIEALITWGSLNYHTSQS